eukprot:g4441.t1
MPKTKIVRIDDNTTKIVTPVTTCNNPLTGIFEIRDCVTQADCVNIIQSAEKYALRSGWTYDRHKFFPTVDIPTKNVPSLRPICDTIHNTIVYPLIRKLFGLHDATFTIADEFIVKYSVDRDARSRNRLDSHRDGSLISYNILLNEAKDFVGGGTHFECIDHTVTPNQGSMVLHCGKLRHSGATITSGTRYILIGFLDVHSIALEDVRKDLKKNLQTDKAWLDTLWKPLRQFFVNDVIQLRGYKLRKSGLKGLSYTYEARIVKIQYGTDYITVEYYPHGQGLARNRCTKVISPKDIVCVKRSVVRNSLKNWK